MAEGVSRWRRRVGVVSEWASTCSLEEDVAAGRKHMVRPGAKYSKAPVVDTVQGVGGNTLVLDDTITAMCPPGIDGVLEYLSAQPDDNPVTLEQALRATAAITQELAEERAVAREEAADDLTALDTIDVEELHRRFASKAPQLLLTRMGSLLSSFTRCDWHTRVDTALRLPERTTTDVLAKYSELWGVGVDFTSLAVTHAMQLVDQRSTC